MKISQTVENLSELILQKVSTFYHILTFLGNFCNINKLSVLKQQLIYLQDKHGKGYLMTHKCRGSIISFSISKSVEPNEEQKEMISGFQQGIRCKH